MCTIKYFSIIQALLLLLTLSSAICLADGGEGSAGGTVARFSGGEPWVLLELGLSPGFKDPGTSAPTTQMRDTPFLKTMGYEYFDPSQESCFKNLQTRLNKWRKNSPITVGLIERALIQMPFKYTNRRVKLLGRYYLPKDAAKPQSMEGAVIYDPVHGARLSKPIWDQLGELSRQGIFIHEPLRHIQLTSTPPREVISDQAIQDITSMILLKGPSADATLDSEKYWDGKFLENQKPLAESGQRKAALQDSVWAILQKSRKYVAPSAELSPYMSCHAAEELDVSSADSIGHLRQQLRGLSKNILDVLETKWDQLTPKERAEMEDLALEAPNLSSLAGIFEAQSVRERTQDSATALQDYVGHAVGKTELSLKRKLQLQENRVRAYLDGKTEGYSKSEIHEIQKTIAELTRYNKRMEESGAVLSR